MKTKDYITINGTRYELRETSDDLVCADCELLEECNRVAVGDLGLCNLFEQEKGKSYNFIKKHTKTE